MPDDGGLRGFRNVSLAQPIIKSHGQFFSSRYPSTSIASVFRPSVSKLDRIAPDFSKRPPNSSTPLDDLPWWTMACAAVFCQRAALIGTDYAIAALHILLDSSEDEFWSV